MGGYIGYMCTGMHIWIFVSSVYIYFFSGQMESPYNHIGGYQSYCYGFFHTEKEPSYTQEYLALFIQYKIKRVSISLLLPRNILVLHTIFSDIKVY